MNSIDNRDKSLAETQLDTLGAEVNIPRGSPREALLKYLDSPERSNEHSHVISYQGNFGTLPPLSSTSRALNDKLINRQVNHNFNVDFNSHNNTNRYYDL